MRKRMNELNIHAYIEEETPAVDKQVRSRSIRARMSMGKVLFPKDAIWERKAADDIVESAVMAMDVHKPLIVSGVRS